MSEEKRKDALRQMEFFRGFTDEHLERLAAISEEVEFQSHEKIFEEHDPAENVYLIVSGKVSLAICAPKIGCRQIMQASAGDLIGWSPLLGRPRLSDTAQTMAPTKAIVFSGTKLMTMCEEDHELGYQFMLRTARVLTERLGATRIQLLNAGAASLPEVHLESD